MRDCSTVLFLLLRRLTLGAIMFTTLAAQADDGPHLGGNIKLRLEDGRTSLPAADAAAYTKALWFGPDLKDATLLEFSARLEVSGRLSQYVAYGTRLMLRNFKAPAFSYPAFEAGFGNTALVADQYYVTVTPLENLTLSIGKHPMLLLRQPNFFWDVDVQPVGASEQYKYALPTASGSKLHHLVGANLGQWLPLPNLRGGPQSVLLLEQLFYQLNTEGDDGYTFEAAVGATQFNGLDRMIANTAIGAGATYALVTNADGTASVQSAPKLDFKAENDATLIGYNPLFLDVHVSATKRSLFGYPLSLQFGLVRNANTSTPQSVTRTFGGAELNAVTAGITYGRVKKLWSWSAGYSYTYKGLASVINGWTDDGFGSDLQGHTLTAELGLSEGASVMVMWRYLQDADGRDKSGAPLTDAQKAAFISNLRVVVSATF